MAEEKHVKSMVIEDVTEQTAQQPWVQMEFFQIGRGKRVGRMESVDLGVQQIVREHQDVAVQKLGVTPPNLCTISCCGLDPNFRFSDLHAGDADAVFLLPGNTEFDVYVSAGARTSYISFDQDELLHHLRVLDPSRWEQTPEQLLAIPNVSRAALERVVEQLFQAHRSRRPEAPGPDGKGLCRMLMQAVLDMMTSSRCGEPPHLERMRAFRICRSALGYLEDRLADDKLPTISKVFAETRQPPPPSPRLRWTCRPSGTAPIPLCGTGGESKAANTFEKRSNHGGTIRDRCRF